MRNESCRYVAHIIPKHKMRVRSGAVGHQPTCVTCTTNNWDQQKPSAIVLLHYCWCVPSMMGSDSYQASALRNAKQSRNCSEWMISNWKIEREHQNSWPEEGAPTPSLYGKGFKKLAALICRPPPQKKNKKKWVGIGPIGVRGGRRRRWRGDGDGGDRGGRGWWGWWGVMKYHHGGTDRQTTNKEW